MISPPLQACPSRSPKSSVSRLEEVSRVDANSGEAGLSAGILALSVSSTKPNGIRSGFLPTAGLESPREWSQADPGRACQPRRGERRRDPPPGHANRFRCRRLPREKALEPEIGRAHV